MGVFCCYTFNLHFCLVVGIVIICDALYFLFYVYLTPLFTEGYNHIFDSYFCYVYSLHACSVVDIDISLTHDVFAICITYIT